MNPEVRWVFTIAGVLLLLGGFRDLLAPTFFAPAGRVLGIWVIVSSFALGAFILLFPIAFIKKGG